ncbi:MAG: hypothetical protein EHM87_24110, partial [Burkholderiales bacterium]
EQDPRPPRRPRRPRPRRLRRAGRRRPDRRPPPAGRRADGRHRHRHADDEHRADLPAARRLIRRPAAGGHDPRRHRLDAAVRAA